MSIAMQTPSMRGLNRESRITGPFRQFIQSFPLHSPSARSLAFGQYVRKSRYLSVYVPASLNVLP